eukprot:TRINITY_DN1327_c0_g1_i1.p1 TRINITY_DN1327_c0_g1~~TRINITY_DN1327_c0_g1_i1.p1  ORF type:complete len:467 (-),score=33.81 TRINITY_DN1327_c0_g1_i1:2077-3477(-)
MLNLKVQFQINKIGGPKEVHSPSLQPMGATQTVKEVKLELYENMVRPVTSKNTIEDKSMVKSEASPPSPEEKKANQTEIINRNSSREFNVEVLLSENQLEDLAEVPKNLTFRSMLSSKLDYPVEGGKEGDESLNITKERVDANLIESPKKGSKNSAGEPKPIPQKDLSPSNKVPSQEIPKEDTAPKMSQTSPAQTREKIALVLLTIQESALGDLWPLWLGICIGAFEAEKYMGLTFSMAYLVLLLLQIASLCTCRGIFVKSIYSRLFLLGMAPIYVATSFFPQMFKSFWITSGLFVVAFFWERFTLFISNSFVLNQLPKNSQALYKIRYVVRFVSYFGSILLLATGTAIKGKIMNEKTVFFVLVAITIGSAICLKKERTRASNAFAIQLHRAGTTAEVLDKSKAQHKFQPLIIIRYFSFCYSNKYCSVVILPLIMHRVVMVIRIIAVSNTLNENVNETTGYFDSKS